MKQRKSVSTHVISGAWGPGLNTVKKEGKSEKRRSFSGFQTRKNELADFTRSDSFHPVLSLPFFPQLFFFFFLPLSLSKLFPAQLLHFLFLCYLTIRFIGERKSEYLR